MVQPQMGVPQKKGMPVWAWIAIGCIGILVLCGVAVTGLVWWGAHKVKSIAQDMQEHPEMATVKMLTAMNPDLELVSTDESAGKVTIRNKKTNETVTVDMADIKNGKLNFESKEGTSSLSFNQDAGKMEVKGADGSTASFGGSAQVPSWVPSYPGATMQGVYSAEDSTQAGGTFGMESSDSFDQVFDHFKGQLEGGGYKVTESKFNGGTGMGGMLVGESADGKHTITYTLSTEDGKTKVAGVYSEKKG